MRRRLLGGLTLLLVLAAGGCGGEEEPQVTDPASDPPTSSAAPVTDPPTSTSTPEPEPESAQAFIRRWQAVSDKMQVSGDTSEYRELGPECEPCAATADLIESYYDAGGFIRYEGTRVRTIDKIGQLRGEYEFEVALDSAPTRYKKAADSAIESFPGGENSIRIRMRRRSGQWTVLDYSVLAS